jgi:hypothetical protein
MPLGIRAGVSGDFNEMAAELRLPERKVNRMHHSLADLPILAR